jgi:hypothetical protein
MVPGSARKYAHWRTGWRGYFSGTIGQRMKTLVSVRT